MTKFTAEVIKPLYAATASLGTSTAGGLPAAVLAGTIVGVGLLAGLMTSTSPGAIALAGVVGGTASLTGDLSVVSSGADVVRQMVSVGGDSWTEGNSSKISRDGVTVVDSDRWDYQAAVTMGIPNYTDPATASSSPAGIINNGYGGQTSGKIYQQIQSRIAADAGRADDIWTWWSGRNDVSKPGGDIWPSVTTGDYSQVFTGTLTSGSVTVTGLSPSTLSFDSLAISGVGIPANCYITTNGSGGGTLSIAATASGVQSLTIEGRGASQFLSLIPHDRKVVFIPYGGGSVTASLADWIRWNKLKWMYRRNYRAHLYELLPSFMKKSASDGSTTDLRDVAAQQIPSSESYAAHPNYVAVPKIAADTVPLFLALQNKGVLVPAQTVPDVPYDMAAGATIEVYLKGFVTSVAITTDDPTLPGIFTISMKPGSSKIALLTRTTTSPGNISRILNLTITASGKTSANTDVSHAGTVRILPSAIGAASTMPVGAYLQRDPNPDTSGQWRRWSRLNGVSFPGGNAAGFTFVMRFKPGEDSTSMNLLVAGSNIIINKGTGGKLAIVIRDSANTQVLNWTGSGGTNFNVAGGYTWLAFSINLATSTVSVWSGRNASDTDLAVGAAGSILTPAASTGLVNLTSSGVMFASGASGYSTFVGSVQSIWIDPRFIDFSNSANRRLFWNTDGSPVNLGADGSTGLTTAPLYYLRGAPGDWVTGKNFGTGPDLAFNDQWLLENDSDPLPMAA